jgi:hypothetical protein
MDYLTLGWQALQWLLIAAGLFCTAIGLITVVQWLRTPPEPNDQSNRVNNIMSWWIGLTRPDVLGKAYRAFKNDVMDNISAIERREQ